MNGKHAIYRVYQALCAGMLSLFPAGRQTLVQGDGCITRIPELLKTHGIKGVQVITTPGTIRRGTVAPLLAQCEDAGIRTVLYTGVSPDPTVTEVDAAAECFFVSGCEAILAIGGGSVIDCAKVAGARTVRRDLPVRKMSGMLKIHKKLPLLLAVPTTAGTGSEVTLAAVITDETCNYKHAVMDYCLIPRYAFLDPGLSCSLPPDMTAYSGMDAMTHAVEAYCNRFCSPKMKAHAMKAVSLIGANLLTAYREPANKAARMNMLTGSYEAGIAFTNAYVGYVHAIAHGIGGLYHVPHGEANAILLPKVLAAYGSAVYEPLARLEREVRAVWGKPEREVRTSGAELEREVRAAWGKPEREVRAAGAEDGSREETDAVLAEEHGHPGAACHAAQGGRAGTCGARAQRGQSELPRSRDLGRGADAGVPDGTGTKVTVQWTSRENIAQNSSRIFYNLTVYIMYAKKYMRFSCNSIQIIYNV